MFLGFVDSVVVAVKRVASSFSRFVSDEEEEAILSDPGDSSDSDPDDSLDSAHDNSSESDPDDLPEGAADTKAHYPADPDSAISAADESKLQSNSVRISY